MSAQSRQELDGLVKQAETLFAQGEMDSACQLLAQVVEAEPNHARALNNLGTICYSRGAFDYAGRFFDRALAIDPGNPICIANLATLMLDRNQLAPARELLEMGATIHPNATSLADLRQELARREIM